MMIIMFHKPVMLKEAIDSLEIKENGVYVDLTFGGGGHSKEILQRINDGGRLIAFDQDESAIKNKIDEICAAPDKLFIPNHTLKTPSVSVSKAK